MINDQFQEAKSGPGDQTSMSSPILRPYYKKDLITRQRRDSS